MGFVIARLAFAHLIFKAQTLIHRIIKLGKSVGKLAPGDEQLKAVRQFRMLVITARKRRNFRWVMIDEVGLNELAFHIKIEKFGMQLLQAFTVGGLFPT